MLIVSGWRSFSALIKWQCEIAPVAFSGRGRIFEIVELRRVRFLSIDGVTEFVFDLRDDFEFAYAEPRDFPEEAETDVCVLFFFFPPRAEYASVKDFICLTELRELA